MRIFISVDMEGLAGVVDVDQTRTNGQDYQRARAMMTAEANAAAQGAFDGGATEVLVSDCHGDMRNILHEGLDTRVQLLSGCQRPLSMAQGLDVRHDGVFLVGYHAGMGARAGILDHTYHSGCIAEIRINGRPMSETALNAMIAGSRGSPVALVTGDDRCCEEAHAILGDVETVTVKWAITRFSARSLHPAEAQRQIREAAQNACRQIGRFKPFTVEPPYELTMRFQSAGMADHAQLVPGSTRVDGTTLAFATGDVIEVYRAMLASVSLAAAAIPQVRKQ